MPLTVGSRLGHFYDVTALISSTVPGRVMARVILVGVVSLLATGSAGAQSVGLTETGRVEGPARLLAAMEGMLAVADGSSVRLVEVDASGAAEVVGRHHFEQPVLGLAFDPDRGALYVANSHAGLVRLDVSDPSAPALAGESPTRGQNVGVAGRGNYVYAADNSLGFDVVGTTSGLVRVGEYLGDGFPRAIAATGSLVLVADQPAGLVVVDASNGELPSVMGGLSFGPDPVLRVFVPAAESSGETPARFACVLSPSAGLQVIDLADPSQPVVAARLEMAGQVRGVALWGDTAYVATEGAVAAWSLRDLARPERFLTADLSTEVQQVAVSATSLFVATPDEVLVFARPLP